MAEASACPHCGKPAPPADRIRACPHCNGPLFEDGSPIAEPHCPLCGGALRAMCIEGGDEAACCPSCKGFWLDRITFARAINPQRIPKRYAESKEHWFKADQRSVQYVACPRCGRFMNRENFARMSGIVVDCCRDHGVWLDEGELESIRLFVASGGLERLQDARLDRLETDLGQLATRTSSLEFMETMLHKWNIKRILFRGQV